MNPTDVALNIGSSALLEIHLQGVVSVNESDFIYQAATNAIIAANEAIDLELQSIGADETILATVSAEMSSETSTGSTDAMSTGGWTLQAADERFNFVFDGDLEPIGSIRLACFGETSAYTTVNSDGASTIAVASGSAIELWPEYTPTPAEDHFTFHQGPIHAIAPGDPAVTFSASTIDPVGFTGTNAIAKSQLAELGGTPGNGASPHQSQHEPRTASQQTNNPHSVPNAVADLAEPGGTPGNGASPTSRSMRRTPALNKPTTRIRWRTQRPILANLGERRATVRAPTNRSMSRTPAPNKQTTRIPWRTQRPILANLGERRATVRAPTNRSMSRTPPLNKPVLTTLIRHRSLRRPSAQATNPSPRAPHIHR